MDQVICGDPYKYHIKNYINSQDRYNLRLVCKLYHKYLPTPEQLVYNNLSKIFGNYTSAFLEKLEQVGAIISGSFILESILEESWNGDIDIYLQSDDKYKFSILENFLYYDLRSDHESSHSEYDFMNDEINIKYHIQIIRNYKYNNKNISIININYSNNSNDFIKDTFDFDILKNIYTKNKLIMYNKDQVYSKTTQFKSTNCLSSSILRYNKYLSRGIIFNNIESITYEDINRYSNYIDLDHTIQEIIIINITDIGSHFMSKDDRFDDYRGSYYCQEISKQDDCYLISKNIQNNSKCEDICPLKMLNKKETHYHTTTWCQWGRRPYIILVLK